MDAPASTGPYPTRTYTVTCPPLTTQANLTVTLNLTEASETESCDRNKTAESPTATIVTLPVLTVDPPTDTDVCSEALWKTFPYHLTTSAPSTINVASVSPDNCHLVDSSGENVVLPATGE